ncbi:MAG: hypothetical protein KJO98_05890, partial [Rhodothermia bacterium]|nr:hypothetical protein [Rhodothermia bacterium]
MRSFTQFSIVITLSLVYVVPAAAQVPGNINFQGNLSESESPFTGSANITFNIYDVDSGGTPLWTESHSSVVV